MRLLSTNLADADAAVLTASSTATGKPASRLKNTLRSVFWEATGKTEESVTADLGPGILTVKAAAITGFDLTREATVEFLHSTDNVTFTSLGVIKLGTPTAGYGEGGFGEGGFGGFSPTLPLMGHVVSLFFSALSSRYWRVVIKDPANTKNIRLGRWFLGDYWEPASVDVKRGWRIEVVDESEIGKTIGGIKSVNKRPVFLRASFQLPPLSESDAFDKLFPIVRDFGGKKDIFIVLFPNEDIETKFVQSIYGSFEGNVSFANVALSNYDAGSINFSESL